MSPIGHLILALPPKDVDSPGSFDILNGFDSLGDAAPRPSETSTFRDDWQNIDCVKNMRRAANTPRMRIKWNNR